MSSATSFIVITETRAMISVCTLSLLFAATFLAAPLVNQDSCDYPPRLAFAELMDEYKEKDSFPVESTVKYKCRPGYVKKPGPYSSTCNRNQQWSKVQELCKRKSCGHPGEPEGGRLLVTGDFDLGSTAVYQCDEGYRMIGKSTRKCKVRNNKMEWTDEVPFCEIIPCLPPPKIPHGKHDGEHLHYFYYSAVVSYSCDKGYPLIGNVSISCISKDGKNGEWNGRAYCGVTQCPSPQIKNGRIVAGVSSTYKYNQKVSFECIGGHEMVGSREIHCQVDGTWDPPIPVCEQVVQCPPAPDIQNGIRSNQETGPIPSGIFVKYTCNPGYALIGEGTLHCTNAGRWSSPAPNCEVVQCQTPPNIQNGTRSNQETAVFPSGMLVTYTCNPGYALIGEATIQCIDNGVWSSPAPNCEGGSCGIPPRLDFANLTDVYQKMNSFPVGSLVQYKCNPGYFKHPGMNASSICIRNQVWSEVQEFCKKKPCGHPGEPENGRLIVSGDFLFGSILSYTCEEGYKLIGQSSRKCALNGKRVKWSGNLPECQPILCSSPPIIPHGEHTVILHGEQSLKEFFYGTTVTYTCDKGYPLIGNTSISCTSKDGINGEWSGRAYCGVARCPSPQIKNGKIVAGVSSTYKYNQKVSLECIGGHEMVGSREIHCQVDGTWDPPIPVCEFVRQCPPPPDIQNGTHSHQETGVFSSGTFVTYTCNPGYALFGEATLHCTNAGKWSSPAPNCEGKSCGHPGKPDGGRLLVTEDFRFGSTVNYQCEEGYRLIGKSSRSCALFGETVAWTGDLPYCQIPGCVNPDIQNGRIIRPKTNDQSVSSITFECDSGYTMKSKHTIWCQRGNTWDSPSPIVVQCQPPPDIQNGIHSNQETLFSSGTLVKYTCNPGYALIGEATIQCMDNGSWSSVPNCEEIECKSPPDIQNGVHSNQEVMVFKRGMCVKYTCNFGYTLIGDATIHCTDSGTWTFPAPHCEQSQCPFPPSIANGKHDGLALQMFTFEMSVTYSCEPGYLLIGKASIFCEPSGNWSLPVPSCEVMHCPTPPKVIHGKHVGEDFTYGKSVIYICDAGYSCIGNHSVTCIWNSSNSVNWSEAPRCQGCLAPPNIAHSKRDKVTLEDFPYGTSVTYHCDPGFFLIGAPIIYCQTSGTWNEPVPQCKRREYTETTKLPSDSQVTKDGNNQIEKITASFIKNTIHSEISKPTTKDLATTLTPGLGGEPDIQRLPEQLNGGNQTDQLNGGNQTDAFPEVRNCSGEVDGCLLLPLSDSTEAETKNVIQASANVILECENGYVRNDSSPIQAQQIGQDAPLPACTLSKQGSYSFATIGFGSLGSILLLLLIFGGVMWIVLLQKKKHNCTCEAQRRYCVANYEDSPL